MPMSVEAAVITKKSAFLDFNTDSVNAAGKLWPRETVHSDKGIRAAGICKDKPYYVLSSSETKGTAESAADLFKTCAENFISDGENAPELIADFFEAFSKVLIDSGYNSSDCDFSVFAGFGTKAYIGKCGKGKAYSCTGGEFAEILPEEHELYDNKSTYGVFCIDNVKENDIFILLTEKVAETLTDAVISAICKTAEGDVKKISALISSQADKLGCTDAVSAVVLKIKEAYPEMFIMPDEPQEAGEAIAAEIPYAMADPENTSAEETEQSEAQIDSSETNISKNKRVGVIVLSVILGVLLLVITFFAVKIISQTHGENSESTSGESQDEQTEENSSEDETEGESESESESESEETSSEEPATDESTSQSEQTTRAPAASATTRPSSTTTTTTTTTTEPESESNSEAESESESDSESEGESSATEPSEENSSDDTTAEEPENTTAGEESTSESETPEEATAE